MRAPTWSAEVLMGWGGSQQGCLEVGMWGGGNFVSYIKGWSRGPERSLFCASPARDNPA